MLAFGIPLQLPPFRCQHLYYTMLIMFWMTNGFKKKYFTTVSFSIYQSNNISHIATAGVLKEDPPTLRLHYAYHLHASIVDSKRRLCLNEPPYVTQRKAYKLQHIASYKWGKKLEGPIHPKNTDR